MVILNTKKTEWDLSQLLPREGEAGFEKARKDVERNARKFIDKWKSRKDYLEKPEVMKEALDEFEKLNRRIGTDGDEGYYYWLRTQQDQLSPDLKAKMTKIQDFSNKLSNDMQFFTMNIAKIPVKKQAIFLKDKSLANYKHFLERSFVFAPHLLGDEAEKVMTLKSRASYEKWVTMVSALLSKEEDQVLTKEGMKKKNFPEIMSLMSDTNKKIRDSSAVAINKILAKHVGIAEEEMNAILDSKKVDDELRNYTRPDQSRHLGDDIDSSSVDAMLETVSKRFDISSRYYKLKARLLKLPKLEYHERNVPYGNLDKKYSYEESIKLVHKVFSSLDKEFAEIIAGFINQGLVDVFPRKGKKDGAFCAHIKIEQPTYILLNHTDKLTDVRTIAHEFGHGINNELARKKQNSLNFETPLSTAEVASTFMEDFVLQEIMKEADDELRLGLMVMKLNDDVATIFRQVACYRFEQELHNEFRKKGYLSKEEIGKIFQKWMSAYMGPSVLQSPGAENWWVYWSHIRSFFYVYSYASGLLISKSLQHSVRQNPKFIEKVKDFLSAGTSDSPRNIFLKTGIDIHDKKFWEAGLAEIEDLLDKTEKLAKKLGK